MSERTYIAIDLKSFYASVECNERGLDPLTTNLVVADSSRTEKTICLAVSPALKSYGIPGRARLFEVVQKVKEVNAQRRYQLKRTKGQADFSGASYDAKELAADDSLAVDYVVATPRMQFYLDYSSQIYRIYLKYIAPEDIHVYSIDEVFMDVTAYLGTYKMTARELAMKMIHDVLDTTGITATAGIAPNLYLAKVAMDVEAKHIPADKDGVRIAELDEMSYRRKLWSHRPLRDFWRVGRGYTAKLEAQGIYTMGDIARCSIQNEDLLYKLFGVNAELLIDHAWGYEPCTMAEIKAYRPKTNSLSSGQVLQCAYSAEKGKIIAREMTDQLVLDLVEKKLVTDQIVLHVGYDIDNLTDPERRKAYRGPVTTDWYGRQVPKSAHGTVNFGKHTSSTQLILEKTMALYDEIVDPALMVRRFNISVNHLIDESEARKKAENAYEQLDLFTDYKALEEKKKAEAEKESREKQMQQALLSIKKKYGKSAVFKGTDLEEGATALERHKQIGGHKA